MVPFLVHSIMRPSINQRIRQLRANGQEVFHFGFGQSPFPVPRAIQAALIEHDLFPDFDHFREPLRARGDGRGAARHPVSQLGPRLRPIG